jgi:hypothetical protein
VAEALAPELASHNFDRDALLDSICRGLEAARIALARPHLNPPGQPDYEW